MHDVVETLTPYWAFLSAFTNLHLELLNSFSVPDAIVNTLTMLRKVHNKPIEYVC